MHTTPHSLDTTETLARLGGRDKLGPSKLGVPEEYGSPSTKSSESEEGGVEEEEVEKSTPSSKKATEAQKTKNVA